MAQPRNKVDSFNPRYVRLRNRTVRHYSDADLAAIHRALQTIRSSNLSVLQADLHVAAVEYSVARARQDRPTKHEVAQRMGQIAIAAKHLLRISGFDEQRHGTDLIPLAIHEALVVRAVLVPKPDEHVRETVRAVLRLHQWAKSAAAFSNNSSVSHARKKPDTALNNFLLALGKIWKTHSGREPRRPSTIGGESTNRGKPAGPFFHFMRACLSPVRPDVTDQALYARLRSLYASKAKPGAGRDLIVPR